MPTTDDGFYMTSGELTIPHGALRHAISQGGVPILVTRISLLSEMSPGDKAQRLCDSLTAAGLETDPSLILTYNQSETDRGPTDHEAVAVVKLTGTEEAQIAYTCADTAYGTETMFKLGCGVIAPTREGNEPRAIAVRLPLGGAPVLTTAVFAGAVFLSKKALAQRVPVLEQGLRQMVLEAAQRAHQEQVTHANAYQCTIDAGPGASSAMAVEHAEHSLLFTKSVSTCLELITTEWDKHYSLYFLSLDWAAGRSFCVTANIDIPFGPQRNKIVGQLLREGFTATVVRVFDGASSTDQVHFEAMAQARSSIDRLLHTGVPPPGMTERLQCTQPDQPFRLMRPGPAAHAEVTPTTLRARLHTASMWRGTYSDYAHDQMDRQQRDTTNEVNGVIEHGWDEPKTNAMMQTILDVAALERITINLSITSATTLAITPGPNPNDSSHLEKTCRAYCERLRLSGETGLTCRFEHAPPLRANPIPQMLLSVMQYEPEVFAGITKWSRTATRRNDAAPEIEGGGARFDAVARGGTGRFQPPSGETALALRSTNNELVRSNASLKQQVATMGAEQLTLRSETRAQIQLLIATHQEETRKNMEEMREMHRVATAAASATQARLDALVKAVTNLPDGARVLHNVFSPTDASGSPTSEISEPDPPRPPGAPTEEDAPPPTGGAPPCPENANGLDDEREPSVRPTRNPLPDAGHITTPRALAERLSAVLRNNAAGITGPTPAPEPGRGERTETSSSNATPGTSTDASPEGNEALRIERELLSNTIRIRRAHLLRTLELARTWWRLAEASCDRNACLPDHEEPLLHLPTGLDSDPHDERAFIRTERPGIQDRQTPPQRHPDDPLDPCDSFSTMTSPAERSRSHARILWALAVLDGAMDQSGDARSSQPDEQGVNESSTGAPGSMPAPDEPTPQPTPDPHPSPAQPIHPNRHLTDDERGTSSKYPEVKGDGAWPPEKAPPPARESLEDFNRYAADAYFASMEAVRVNPSAGLDLVMLQALDKMLAGIKVRDGRAPPSSLAQYGYHPSDSLLPNCELTEDERGILTDDEKGKDGDEADGSTRGDDHYEDTPPSSTDHPRPEHMVNTAVPDGRGVMIRAGGGSGSSVSDENCVRPPEHVSANEKASPPAQDSREDPHPPASELVAYEEHLMMEFMAGDTFRDERCFSLRPVLAHEQMMLAHEQTVSSHGYRPMDLLPPNRHLTEDERGVSAKYPEVKGDGAMARQKKRATTAAATKATKTRSLAVVMTVPPDEPYDDGMDTPTAPGPWHLISGSAAAAAPPEEPSPPLLRNSRAPRRHSPTSERTRQSQAADPPPTGNEPRPLVRPVSFAQGPTPPTTSARGRRHAGWSHRRDHEHLLNEFGEQLTEEEHLERALQESVVTSDDHACAPPDADDPDPTPTDNRAHPAASDAAHPCAEREVGLNDGDVVSDEEEILQLAAALEASTTDVVAAAPKPVILWSLDSPVTGTIADLVRPVGPSDKIHAKNAKHRICGSDDDDTSGDSDSGDTGNDPNPAAAVANGKRPRAGLRTTGYWRRKPVPEQEWHKSQARAAHLADELTRPDVPEDGRNFAVSEATEAGSDGVAVGRMTGPDGVRAGHIFRHRVKLLVNRHSNAEPDDANGAPDVDDDSGPDCRAGRSDALEVSDRSGSAGGSEAPPAPDVEQAFPDRTGARPLRKLQLKFRPMVSRAPPPHRPDLHCTPLRH